MALDVTKTLEDLKKMYEESPHSKSFKGIVYGGTGSGKTHLIRTCRTPILVDSFDPGGQHTNEDYLKDGRIYADTRWELEDPENPTSFMEWDKVFTGRKREGLFSNIGTYVIDSATTLASSIMNTILKKAGRAGAFPFQQDYGPAMAILEKVVHVLTTLPCDVLLLCHEDSMKDEVTGKMFISPLFWGKLKGRLPLLFDEIYHAESKEAAGGVVKYTLLTRSTGLYQARTRIGSDGKFDTYEEPNITRLLQKAGYIQK